MLVSGASMHPLDRPIWSARTTRQQALDMSVQSFAALGAIMSGSEIAALFTPDAASAPAEFTMLLALPAARDGNPPAFLRDGVAQANVMYRRK